MSYKQWKILQLYQSKKVQLCILLTYPRYNLPSFYIREIDAKHNYFLLFTGRILVDRPDLFRDRWNLAG